MCIRVDNHNHVDFNHDPYEHHEPAQPVYEEPCFYDDAYDPQVICVDDVPPVVEDDPTEVARARVVAEHGEAGGELFDEFLMSEIDAGYEIADAIGNAEAVVDAVFTEPDFIAGWRNWAGTTGVNAEANLEGIENYLAQRANIARAAYNEGNDPLTWLADQDFFALMFSESRWDPTAANANSSAAGIGQITQPMWAAHMAPEIDAGLVDENVGVVAELAAEDPTMATWELVGVMRYIEASYVHPTNARNFFVATVYEEGSERQQEAFNALPPGLQAKATSWRDQGYGGY